MQHYVALVWAPDDKRAGREATRVREVLLYSWDPIWEPLVRTDGLVVYSKTPVDAAMSAYVLADGRGTIVGRLFSSPPNVRPIRSAELAPVSHVASIDRWLQDRYWGQYVGFFRTPNDSKVCVLRDCSGHIPCFYLYLNGLYLFFSDLADLQALHLRFSINKRYLSAFISRQPLHVRETGLNEVTELLAGDRVTVAAGSCHISPWNPRSIVADRAIDNYDEASSSLVTLSESIIAAWATCYRRILLTLSGGLDSAIVLGCLKRLGLADRVVCVTQYTPGTADDERLYARSAAQMAGVSLTELPRISDGRLYIEKLDLLPPDPRPDISKTDRLLFLDALNGVADEFGCDTLWTGQGGDQIFLQVHHPYGAADYLIQHRTLSGFASVVYQSALLSRHSVWSVLSDALSYKFRRGCLPPAVVGGRGSRFLAEGVPAGYAEESLALPWRGGSERIPPGKLDQLDLLFDLLNRHKPIIGLERPYEQHPLISQPLLELSLRIPTYHLLRGGRQRSLARAAFADRVPAGILMREDKGSVTEHVRSILREGAPYIRERLLDGRLVSLGIIRRSALEGILRQEETFAKDDLFPIFASIAIEAWMQHWTLNSAQSVAA